MKKILVILNESRIPQRVIQRAIIIAKESNALLEAVFINDINGLDFGYPFPNDLYLVGERLRAEIRTADSIKLLQDIATVFEHDCNNAGVTYTIEIEKAVSLKHLIQLSNFADLIIADAKSDSDEYSLKDLLADAHCPLLLISKHAAPVEKIFIAYDGSASSMHAAKMFSYIFPEYKNFAVHFFQIADTDANEITSIDEIKSWASKHFFNIHFQLIHGGIKKELVEYIRTDSENSIVVMGAYGSNALTRLFVKSTADAVLKETYASLFITH